MLSVSNIGYNCTKYLIDEKGFSPKDKGAIQKIVTRKSLEDNEDKSMVYPDAFKYSNILKGTTRLRLTAMHQYFAAYKASKSLHKGNTNKFEIKYKDIEADRGTFGVPRMYVNRVTEKDLKHVKGSKSYDKCQMLKILPDFFALRYEHPLQVKVHKSTR